jgi:hypothetical protein
VRAKASLALPGRAPGIHSHFRGGAHGLIQRTGLPVFACFARHLQEPRGGFLRRALEMVNGDTAKRKVGAAALPRRSARSWAMPGGTAGQNIEGEKLALPVSAGPVPQGPCPPAPSVSQCGQDAPPQSSPPGNSARTAKETRTRGLCPLVYPPGFNALQPKLAFYMEIGQNAVSRHGG